MSGAAAAGSQEYCLKWNNHRSTILSVMDTLLEEESLVDVTLSADGQILRAHRVVLSACSPYFRSLFKSDFLNDRHPVIVLKDVEFENLKSLVEYMYKGEANVPQHMLSTFIQTAESLQIRGLAEGASKQKLEQVAELNNKMANSHLNIPSIPITPQISSPFKQEPGNNKKGMDSLSGGILAARLAKMVDTPPMQMFDFHEQLALAARQHAALVPPPMKKPRKTPITSSPLKGGDGKPELSIKKDLLAKTSRMSPKTTNIMTPSAPNNNYESDSDVLKIDEDRDKENKENAGSDLKDDDISEMETGENGVDDSEEEAMSKQELAERAVPPAVGFINPWTGEEIPGIHGGHASNPDDDDNEGGTTRRGWVGTPSSTGGSPPLASPPGESPTRLKRITNTDSVYTMCQTPEGSKFQCAICARVFNLKCTLLRHVRHQHQGRFVPHPCKTCGQVFKRTDHLKVHMKKIHNLSIQNTSNNNAAHSPNPLVNTL